MSDDNLILDAAQVRTQCHRVLNGGKPFREERVSKLLDSHEALRAALATAEAERDTWKAYAARVAQEARDNFGVAEAAVERVGVLEAALRDTERALAWALQRDDSPQPRGVEL